jgi:class 3 adenylate cyclase
VPAVTVAESRTRGFLFADLRGYSAFVERHGDDAGARLLRAYRDLVRKEVARFAGAEIRTEGDSFYLVFESASAAVRCGLAILHAAGASRAAAGGPIRVGIGIHAGETTETDEGYVGSAVNIAARVCAVARPGEVLVTDTVQSLVRTRLPVRFIARGSHRLKGISRPVEAFRVEPAPGGTPAGAIDRAPIRERLAGQARLMGITAAAAVVLVIGVGVVAALMAREPGPPEGPTGARPNASALPGADESPATADEFPTELETELLAALPAPLAETCHRASDDSLPIVSLAHAPGQPEQRQRMQTRAALECEPDAVSAPDVVYVLRAAAISRMAGDQLETFLFQLVANRGLDSGDCAVDRTGVSGTWSFGAYEGRMLCYVTERSAYLWWDYEGRDLLIEAVREDADPARLYEWWLAEGRLIAP